MRESTEVMSYWNQLRQTLLVDFQIKQLYVDIKINVNNIPKTLTNFGLSIEDTHGKVTKDYS